MKPLCIDIFSGLGGWSAAFLAEGYRVVAFDWLDMHAELGLPRPREVEFVQQDARTLHGSQFKDAACIVASPPCTHYSYMAMPWKRAKKMAAALRGQGEFPSNYTGPRTIAELNELFNACFRLQREASEAAGHHIPMVVENVCGAQRWVGSARWHFGSYFLWGDVPALMPQTLQKRMKCKVDCSPRRFDERVAASNEDAHAMHFRLPADGQNRLGRNFHAHENGLGSSPSFNGGEHETRGVKGAEPIGPSVGNGTGKTSWFFGSRADQRDMRKNADGKYTRFGMEGKKGAAAAWFNDHKQKGIVIDSENRLSYTSSRSAARKAASAMIAEIPFDLAQHIARCFK